MQNPSQKSHLTTRTTAEPAHETQNRIIIDRKQAGRINPLIDRNGASDTLFRCRYILALITELTGEQQAYGEVLQLGHRSTTDLHYLLEILDAALEYEEYGSTGLSEVRE